MSTLITVTKLRETTNRHGDDTLTEDGVVEGCIWAPGDSTEDNDGRDQAITKRLLFAPPGHGITDGHRVRFPDMGVWTVEGDPKPWASPFPGQWYPGDQIQLEQVTG